ncbi:MAG: TraB/GumN family protein [Gammaproteobacteria bacterium]|nr:TraB/GumN family protein [Gammaproteobacteria bacterium]MCB1923133.1 TraB/GumN family protein [Gammaproteobacteria bacterium]
MLNPEADSGTAASAPQPMRTLTVDDMRITLLGTAHVSRSSAEQVASELDSGAYDAVAIELCPSRHEALMRPDRLAELDLMQVIRQGKAAMVMANLAMAAYQQRLGEQLGIEPGAEMRMAIDQAQRHDLPVLLIDREIGTTLNRTARSLSWWRRATLFSGLVGSLISREEVSEEDIEHLKEGDVVETTFAEFAHDRNDLYQPLIAERDRYMAAKLRAAAGDHPGRHVLAVVGAGHLAGIARHLGDTDEPHEVIELLDSVPSKARWPRLIPWLIVVLVLFGFYLGFSRNPDLGWQLVRDWVLINGGLSALGALIAAGHPLTVVTAFIAAPITSLNPTIGAGMVTAAAELWLRRPRVGDFSRLRGDTATPRGWWRNRVSRTLLVFLFSTLGSALGTYLAGYLIFDRLNG